MDLAQSLLLLLATHSQLLDRACQFLQTLLQVIYPILHWLQHFLIQVQFARQFSQLQVLLLDGVLTVTQFLALALLSLTLSLDDLLGLLNRTMNLADFILNMS
jgi:hypothetical protein